MMDNLMQTLIGWVAAVVVFCGIIWRTWVSPLRQERDELVMKLNGFEIRIKGIETEMGKIRELLSTIRKDDTDIKVEIGKLDERSRSIIASIERLRKDVNGKKGGD